MLGVILNGSQEGDAHVGEEILGEVLAQPEIRAVGANRAYDSDPIRARIKVAGKKAVLPPRANHLQLADYDKENYKQRNKAEQLFVLDFIGDKHQTVCRGVGRVSFKLAGE